MNRPGEYVIGIDVGTGSARAGLFDLSGRIYGSASTPITLWKPEPEFAEQSSDEIWKAIGTSIRNTLKEAKIPSSCVIGISFDATCSLVALDSQNQPVSLSPTGNKEQNIIVWMDHRAIEQAKRINRTEHPVLKYVGGQISPEMELPKILWVKDKLKASWKKIARLFDLADYLTFRATHVDTRSLCTTVCKWTYLGHQNKWDATFFKQIGLLDLLEKNKIGSHIRPMGELAGGLTETAAKELGLPAGIAVGVGIIDAHAGGLGVLGMTQRKSISPELLETNLALIGGTSSCHMAVSRKPKFIKGIWGPYYSAMIPGMWLTEGGQSATGALVDRVLVNNQYFDELKKEAHKIGLNVYELLNARVSELQRREKKGPELTSNFHILDYYHGNRSPIADPTAKGMVCGLSLDSSINSLAVSYLATIQSIAYGTRNIIEAMNRHGYRIKHIHACGGGTKNPLWLQEHADITGCTIVLPEVSEAMLLGTAMLAAVAAGRFKTVLEAMSAMSKPGEIIRPRTKNQAYHNKKYKVYKKLYQDQLSYKKIMSR